MLAKQTKFLSKWYGPFFFLVEPRELLDLRLSASADNTDSSWRDCVIGTYAVWNPAAGYCTGFYSQGIADERQGKFKMPCQLRCCEMSKAVKRLCGEGWGGKAQEDEEQLKAREGGEFSLNSFRLPLQVEDVKSSSNLPGLQIFFFARH